MNPVCINRSSLMLYLLLFLFPLSNLAQPDPESRFGKLTAKDFEKKVYEIDSAAAAVVLIDKGKTEIQGNTKGWFSLRFHHQKRIHILNKNGYDAADIEIPLYRNEGLDEDLQGLKATTYNLEDGKVVETRLDKKAVFTDRVSKNLLLKKFTLPNVKEGSIIEVEYHFNSDFIFNLQPWAFQGSYPRLWSEYSVSIPEFLGYIKLMQGYHVPHINETKTRYQTFSVTERSTGNRQAPITLQANVSDQRLVLKDVPALKAESYTSTLKNHIARIDYQLAEYRHPLVYRKIMGSWEEMSKSLREDEDFGAALTKDNGWLKAPVDNLTGSSSTLIDQARAIYDFVRSNIICTNHSARYLSKPIRNVFNDKNGNVADINILLTAMLNRAGFIADPVLLSSRSYGYSYELYPIMDRFNYVISRLKIGENYYYLDASQPSLGFGKLGTESYNGHGRVIDLYATPVYFNADSLRESSLTIANIAFDTDGKLIGSVKHTPGFYESVSIRNSVREKGMDQLFSEIGKSFNGEVSISNNYVDSLSQLDLPVSLRYDLKFDNAGEDILYFNPMLGEGWKSNPFNAAKRFYPVEMPYTINENFLLNISIPEGYDVDEMPKQITVRLNEDGDGMFDFRVSKSGGIISLRSSLRLTRAYFLPEEYDMLREFFSHIVKKHNEQIVLKKKAKP